jgi:putative hydrolase of the HAD superfamily
VTTAFDAVLFDLDDTLLDADTAWRSGIARLLTRCPQVDRDAARLAWDTAFKRHFPLYLAGEMTFAEHQAARIRSWATLVDVPVPTGAELDWFGDYLAGYSAAWTAFADVAPCLTALAGMRFGVITNGESVQQRAKIAALGLTEAFAVVVASGDIGIAKPDPRIFRHAVRQLGTVPDRCVFVGDRRDTDALAAAAAGMKGVWLNRTFGEQVAGAAPPAGEEIPEIATLAELPMLLDPEIQGYRASGLPREA